MRPKINQHVCTCKGTEVRHTEPYSAYVSFKKSHNRSVHGNERPFVMIFGKKMFLKRTDILYHKNIINVVHA